jgi:hypothetical protein
MTEEQLDGFKELAESIEQNTHQAYERYKKGVDRIYVDNVQNVNEIERLLDYILTYCGDEKMVAASFLNDTTKRDYFQSFQGRLKQLTKA